MNATSVNSPKSCFGIGQTLANVETCSSCEYRTECEKYSGKSLMEQAIDCSKFNLLPDKLLEVDYDKDDEFKLIYDECYKMMFSGLGFLPDSLHKCPGIRLKVEELANKTKCPVRLFITTCMYGHKEANPEQKFFCNMLSGQAALNRVSRYKADVIANFGALTEETISDYAGEQEKYTSYETIMLQSEIAAGNWIVGYKSKRSGNIHPYFYQDNELLLDTLWLVTEPTYHQLLIDSTSTPDEWTHVEKVKRIKNAKTIIQIKRRGKESVRLFKIRESIMPKAIATVLQNKGLQAKFFKVQRDREWKSTLDFWVALGIAVQHYWCTEFVYGDRSLAAKKLALPRVE